MRLLIYLLAVIHYISVIKCQQTGKDRTLNVPKLIKSRGFKVETHHVITEDGYILTIHRIVNPLRDSKGRPVILQHGLLSSGRDWIDNALGGAVEEMYSRSNKFVGNNLGFELSKAGHDVWLTNSRGNTYGRNHTKLNHKTDSRFWDFSFDQLIDFDLPATIDYVLKTTNQQHLGFVGHSQGAMIMFGLLSMHAKYNQIVKPFIALSPVASLANMKSPLKNLARNSLIQTYFKGRAGRFLPSSSFVKMLTRRCSLPSKSLCSNTMLALFGYNEEQLDLERLPVYMAGTPAGTSVRNMMHFAQGFTKKRFAKFDHGPKMNLVMYGNKIPPEYSLENITNTNIALISSRNDWLADQKDVDILRHRLCVRLHDDFVVLDKKWSHLDYIWAKDTGKVINSRVLALLDKKVRDHDPRK